LIPIERASILDRDARLSSRRGRLVGVGGDDRIQAITEA
jgi:hypothetical protein